ncbi:MAG: universal stress protein [Burkholderiales bacterium]|nr:universal stress protein [Burkholderiales bacterium]
MRLLLAVDGSECSLRATHHVIATAGLYREPLHVELVTVHLPVPKIGGFSGAVLKPSMIDDYYKDEGNAALAASRKALDQAGVAYTPHILVGDIAETIAAHAKSTGCREICIGTRGMTALGSLVLGSVAARVVHVATVPVVLVK